MRIRHILISTVALTGILLAQTTNPPPAPAVQAFNIERDVTLNALNSTLTPNISASVLAAVQAGALALRETINFSPNASLLTINLFTVQPGAPLPTPAGTNLTSGGISVLTVKVDKTYIVTMPINSVMFVGTVATNSPPSPFGDLTGEPVAVSVGFTNDTPPAINNVVTLIGGTVVDYSASASGTLTLTGVSVTPPNSTGNGIQIVIKSPTSTVSNFISLDASGTTGGTAPLKYSWTATSGTATVFGPNNAIATAQLAGFGTYVFQVTVTDAKGNTASKTVTITYD